MFIALYKESTLSRFQVESKRDGIRILDTQTGVVRLTPFDEAVSVACNLEVVNGVALYNLMGFSFVCRALDLAFCKSTTSLHWRGYTYELYTLMVGFDIVGGILQYKASGVLYTVESGVRRYKLNEALYFTGYRESLNSFLCRSVMEG